jgi:hypothetical protein
MKHLGTGALDRRALARTVLALVVLGSLGGLQGAAAADVHLVAVIVTSPSAQDEPTLKARERLEQLAKSTLGALPGISIVEATPRGASPGAASSLEGWARQERFVFLVRAEMIEGAEKEWAVSWWLADLRKAREMPMSSWPKHSSGRPEKLTNKSGFDGMLRIVTHIQDTLGTLVPEARRRKSVLVSCFHVREGKKSSKAGQLSGVASRLAQDLPASLKKMWEKPDGGDFESLALQPTHLETCCAQLKDPERLADYMARADYVIGGYVSMQSAEEAMVLITVFRKGSSPPGEFLGNIEVPLSGDLQEAHEEVADEIRKRLPQMIGSK